jgi:hypothetical protein
MPTTGRLVPEKETNGKGKARKGGIEKKLVQKPRRKVS